MDTTKSQYFRPAKYSELRAFTDPVLHKTDKWYIDFKSLEPISGKMRRKKYYVKECSSIRQRGRIANEMLSFLAVRLREGWSPWAAEDHASSQMSTFAYCLDKYMQYVSTIKKKSTHDSYSSRVNVLRQYIGMQKKPILMAYQFDTAFCCGFLDYILIEKGDNVRTRNNYRNWLFSLAEFLRLRSLIVSNPVDVIGLLKECDKFRKDLTVQMLSELSVYLKAHDKYFYLACLMEYYAFIRPNELSYLKVGCVQVKSQIIRLPPETTKNGKDGNVVLNKKIIMLMLDLDILNKPGDCYIFSHGCMPGKEYVGPDQFNKKWKTIRMALGWSSRYQFYSLKDSGIRDLANTEGIAVTRDQARHMDISTTNRYIQRHAVHECVKGFDGNL